MPDNAADTKRQWFDLAAANFQPLKVLFVCYVSFPRQKAHRQKLMRKNTSVSSILFVHMPCHWKLSKISTPTEAFNTKRRPQNNKRRTQGTNQHNFFFFNAIPESLAHNVLCCSEIKAFKDNDFVSGKLRKVTQYGLSATNPSQPGSLPYSASICNCLSFCFV